MLHVYPLDAKTKEGAPFWSLPKRPPTPSVFDPENMLHLQFITSMACLDANIFWIKIPSDKPRTDQFRKEVGQMAVDIKVPDFVPDDSAAKEIQSSVDKEANKDQEEDDKEEKKVEDEKDGKKDKEDKEEKKQEETQIDSTVKASEFDVEDLE